MIESCSKEYKLNEEYNTQNNKLIEERYFTKLPPELISHIISFLNPESQLIVTFLKRNYSELVQKELSIAVSKRVLYPYHIFFSKIYHQLNAETLSKGQLEIKSIFGEQKILSLDNIKLKINSKTAKLSIKDLLKPAKKTKLKRTTTKINELIAVFMDATDKDLENKIQLSEFPELKSIFKIKALKSQLIKINEDIDYCDKLQIIIDFLKLSCWHLAAHTSKEIYKLHPNEYNRVTMAPLLNLFSHYLDSTQNMKALDLFIGMNDDFLAMVFNTAINAYITHKNKTDKQLEYIYEKFIDFSNQLIDKKRGKAILPSENDLWEVMNEAYDMMINIYVRRGKTDQVCTLLPYMKPHFINDGHPCQNTAHIYLQKKIAILNRLANFYLQNDQIDNYYWCETQINKEIAIYERDFNDTDYETSNIENLFTN